MRKYIIVILSFLTLVLKAQNFNIKFSSYSTSQGLSNDNINGLMVDSKGFLWIGTWNGLNKWDGNKFTVYKHDNSNPNSLVQDHVFGIFEDRKSRIWVSTVYGLSLYKPEIDGFENIKSFESKFIGGVFEDRFNQIWVLARNDFYIYNYDKKTAQKIQLITDTISNPLSNQILKYYKDADTVWLAMANGDLRKLNIQSQTSELCTFNYKFKHFFKNTTINVIYKDRKGFLWIAYNGIGIVKLNTQKKIINEYKHSELSSSIGSNDIYQFYEDNQGKLWISCSNGNLNLYIPEKEAFIRFEPNSQIEYSIKGTSVSSIIQDKFNNLWIGTHGVGLMCINPFFNQFINFNPILPNKANPVNIISCFYESPDKTIWIGTNDYGLLKYNPVKQTITSVLPLTNFPSKTIQEILPASNDKLWLATWGNGLLLFDTKTGNVKTFKTDPENNNSISCDYIKSICLVDSTLWICCFGKGINIMNLKNYTILNSRNSKTNDERFKPLWVLGMLRDSQKRIWISTVDNLYLFAKNKLTMFGNSKNEIQTNNTVKAFEDSNHKIWLSTHEGLTYYNETSRRFEKIKECVKIKDFVNAIEESKDGYMWFTTDNGVIKYSNKNGFIKRYSIKDGLPSNAYVINSILKSSDGKLYVGSYNGFSIIDTKRLLQNITKPEVYFNDFQVFNISQKPGIKGSPLLKSISLTDTIILHYSQSIFSISYIGLDMSASHNVQYAYKMQGFNDNWQYVGSDNKASYTNLRQGTYTFCVKACNGDGVWNYKEAKLTIIVLPPWWETWWFKIIIIVAFLIIIIHRIYIYKKQKVVLERLVDHRTKQLSNAFEELKLQNDVIEIQKVDAIEKTRIITESIQYAKIIQESILPLDVEIQAIFPQSFILYKPLNIVSGDFYWIKNHNELQYLVVADCTGHGVPGAFMSLLGITLLNDILHYKSSISASEILSELRFKIKQELHQSTRKQTSRDGMDMVICIINKEKKQIEFAGANISLMAIKTKILDTTKEKYLIEYKGDKMPVGIHIEEKSFTSQLVPFEKNDVFYISTDGYRDQMGGEKDAKYGSRRFKDLLLSIHNENFAEQNVRLSNEFEMWKGQNDQIDDVTIMGFSVDL